MSPNELLEPHKITKLAQKTMKKPLSAFVINNSTLVEFDVPFEVFVNNTNLTFLAFLYKISIEVS